MATANLNRWVGTANLTRDPEIKTTQGGTKIAELRIAVNSRVKRGDEWVDKPNYFTVATFGAKVDAIERYLKKGSGVAIDGRLDFSEWEKDGEKRSSVTIIADSVQFTDGKPREDDPSGGRFEEPPIGPAGQDDDIPF